MTQASQLPLRRFSWAGLVLVLLLCSGCAGDLPTDYGASKGFLAQRSVNGFTTFRDAFQEAGFYDRDIGRLTNRSREASVIVWTPKHPSGIDIKVTTWFERWLQAGHKTLIYVIPDSGSEADFYRDARPLASPAQRLEYRRKYAEQLIVQHQWQLRRTAIPSNGWFAAQPKVQQSRMELADESLTEQLGWEPFASDDTVKRLEWVLEAADNSTSSKQTVAGPIWEPVGPGSPPFSINLNVAWSSKSFDFQPLLQSEQGDPLVARITNSGWEGSQILVIAGGSLLTNYGLTQPENQWLADQLIALSQQTLVDGNRIDAQTKLFPDGSEPQVGFANASGSLPISERAGQVPRASGMELLTTFPISVVTMHLAVIGVVVCLMLLPIFGRPRSVDRGVLTHFGDHLSAVATLMRRRGGETYARKRISDYMRQVREEVAGPWVMEPTPHRSDPAIQLQVPKPIVSRTRDDDASPPGAASPGAASPGAAPTRSEHSPPIDAKPSPPDTDSQDRG